MTAPSYPFLVVQPITLSFDRYHYHHRHRLLLQLFLLASDQKIGYFSSHQSLFYLEIQSLKFGIYISHFIEI
jgi:hypothetical protein